LSYGILPCGGPVSAASASETKKHPRRMRYCSAGDVFCLIKESVIADLLPVLVAYCLCLCCSSLIDSVENVFRCHITDEHGYDILSQFCPLGIQIFDAVLEYGSLFLSGIQESLGCFAVAGSLSNVKGKVLDLVAVVDHVLYTVGRCDVLKILFCFFLMLRSGINK